MDLKLFGTNFGAAYRFSRVVRVATVACGTDACIALIEGTKATFTMGISDTAPQMQRCSNHLVHRSKQLPRQPRCTPIQSQYNPEANQ